jgi:ABC-type antimicrobial peptide transport system permease subunit
MHSILVVFVILLAILLLISALGGSLNIQEKFEDDKENPTVAEMFYETSTEEEQPLPTEVPTEMSTETSSQVPTTTPSTVEAFSNGVEPFEDEDTKYGAPL